MVSGDLLLDRLFDEGHRADVKIYSSSGCIVYAHANILVSANVLVHHSVLAFWLSKRIPFSDAWICLTTGHGFSGISRHAEEIEKARPPSDSHGWRSPPRCDPCFYPVPILFTVTDSFPLPRSSLNVICDLILARFFVERSYEKEDMKEFVLHLLVLSHSYVVPQLKRLCEDHLERGMINMDNVVDIFQLALLCDASRLSFVCHRIIMRNFKDVSATEGWTAMKKSHPVLEKLLVEYLIEEDNVSVVNSSCDCSFLRITQAYDPRCPPVAKGKDPEGEGAKNLPTTVRGDGSTRAHMPRRVQDNRPTRQGLQEGPPALQL